MPGAKKYIDGLDGDDLVVNIYPVALHVPAILVRKGNDAVTSWDDLAKEGVRVGMSNPELASAGRAADKIIGQSPLEAQIRANVTELAADARGCIQLLLDDKVDAVIVWRSTIRWAPDKVEAIEIPTDINDVKEIWFACLSYSSAESEAAKFAEFVASPEGQQAFSDKGFLLIGG
jgi:molybdate transport system substrate-binding protein